MEAVMDGTLAELRQTFSSGRTRSARWRRSQLEALLRLVREKEEELYKVLEDDLGKPRVEAYRDEVGVLIRSLNHALGNVKKWMAPRSVAVPLLALPTTAKLVPEPLGLVLIFSSWNFPLGLALDPLVGAIAAGNVAVLKPSELAPASSSFLAKTIPQYLDTTAVRVFEGGAEVGEQLLSQKWDHIFFTGSQRIGRLVMAAAAEHLTPVTLELGGKCPAILDSLSSRKQREIAVKRIVNGKWGACGGQVCIGIDYLLVEEKSVQLWLELIKGTVKGYYGEDPRATGGISRIVNRQHFTRLKNLLLEPAVAASIIHGGSVLDEENMYIEPTILLNPPLESQIMTEEIFGPLLPVITLNKIEDGIKIIKSLPKPLAVYAFTKDSKLKEKIVAETSSGCVCFDDAIIQFLLETVPFGGVGHSGFGRYHGKFSFDNFSHEKPVVGRHYLFEFSFGYPPWKGRKLRLLHAAYNYDYLNLALLLLGLKR